MESTPKMDLKDFVKETIKAVVEATSELQSELATHGAIVNPPTSSGEQTSFEVGGVGDTLRRVQSVDFDVALTTSTTGAGGAKGGLKVWVVEASTDASHSHAKGQENRVRFSIPISLPPSQ